MNFEVRTSGPISTVVSESGEVTLPHTAGEPLQFGETAVVLMGTWQDVDSGFWERLGVDAEEKLDQIDFELQSQYRNVVGIGGSGTVLWHIPEAPHDAPADDIGPYYMTLLEIEGALWVRNRNRYTYRVDPETGEILESLPANQLRLEDQTIEFQGGWVDQVLERNDLIAIRLEGSGHPDPDGRNLYVLDPDGSERWWIGGRLDERASPDAPPFTDIWFEDDELRGYATDGYEYRFDPEDGTLHDQIWRK